MGNRFLCAVLVLVCATPAGADEAADAARAIEREIVVMLAGASGAFDPGRVRLVTARDAVEAAAALEAFARDPAVAWAEPNQVREPCVWSLDASPARRAGVATVPDDGLWHPDDPLYRDGRQWGPAAIAAPAAWMRSRGDPAVIVAIADTGLDPSHPDLTAGGVARLAHPINVTGEPVTAWEDVYGHGTPVAGIAVARANNGATFDSLGIAGIAGGDGADNPGVRIMPIRITRGTSGLASSFDIAGAIVHAVACGARVLNLSFAGRHPSALERAALEHAIARGCLVVTAIGNRGASTPELPLYPAAYAADGLCLAVGAIGPDGARAAFSSYGPGLDLLAPGVDVWTTFMTYPSAAGASYPGYVRGSGTSFAAPFAAGAAALLAAARPALDASDLRALLRGAARDVGAEGPDRETGWGTLDAAAALARVGGEVAIVHDEVAATALRTLATDTLVVPAPGPGTLTRWVGAHRATCVEAIARIAIPDSLADPVQVWPRVAGTFAMRSDFRPPYVVPWAEVAGRDGRWVTLRGHLFRIEGDHGDDGWVPLPPDQIRIGYTLIGRRVPPAAAAAVERPRPLDAAPNPFRHVVRLRGTPGAAVAIYDVAGRRCGQGRLDSEGIWVWNGRDASGHELPAGLYFARSGLDAARTTRLVRIR